MLLRTYIVSFAIFALVGGVSYAVVRLLDLPRSRIPLFVVVVAPVMVALVVVAGGRWFFARPS